MLRLLFTAVLVLSISACSVSPVTDYRVDNDFSQYTTFAFAPSPNGAPVTIDGSRIRNEIVPQLEQKGLSKTDINNAELQVSYRIEKETQLQSSGSYASFGYSRNKRSVSMSSPQNYYERKYGKLVLEFIDSETQSVIWKSISRNKLSETISTEKRSKFISDEITRMLTTYPPSTK